MSPSFLPSHMFWIQFMYEVTEREEDMNSHEYEWHPWKGLYPTPLFRHSWSLLSCAHLQVFIERLCALKDRELLVSGGCIDCRKSNLLNHLSQNHSIVLYPGMKWGLSWRYTTCEPIGGAVEAFHTSNLRNDIYIPPRKGFIRLAIETGSPIVPVYAYLLVCVVIAIDIQLERVLYGRSMRAHHLFSKESPIVHTKYENEKASNKVVFWIHIASPLLSICFEPPREDCDNDGEAHSCGEERDLHRRGHRTDLQSSIYIIDVSMPLQ